MIEGLLTHPNVRTHENYDKANLEEARDWIREDVEAFDNIVFMGVPSSEKQKFIETGKEILESDLIEESNVYAHESIGKGLEGFDYKKINYSKSPSRIADVNWMNEEFSGDESIAVVSFDYNVRTGSEIDQRMENHGTSGQFILDFDDFQDFTITNYVKNFFPETESFEDEVKDREKDFSYEIPNIDDEPVVVLNVPYSDNIEEYNPKIKSEALRDGLARLPYGQKMKDIGKKGLGRVLGSFEY